jgi:hypothetical protein
MNVPAGAPILFGVSFPEVQGTLRATPAALPQNRSAETDFAQTETKSNATPADSDAGVTHLVATPIKSIGPPTDFDPTDR